MPLRILAFSASLRMDSLNASLARVAATCQDMALLLFCICQVIALHIYALTSQIVSLKTDWVNIENSCPMLLLNRELPC